MGTVRDHRRFIEVLANLTSQCALDSGKGTERRREPVCRVGDIVFGHGEVGEVE